MPDSATKSPASPPPEIEPALRRALNALLKRGYRGDWQLFSFVRAGNRSCMVLAKGNERAVGIGEDIIEALATAKRAARRADAPKLWRNWQHDDILLGDLTLADWSVGDE